MGFRSLLLFNYSETHERRFWNKLVELLEVKFQDDSRNIILVGNLVIKGKEPDAVLIKEDCIVAIDFKDYGGDLQISENADWFISGVKINVDRKNPYQQVSEYKYALLDALKSKLPMGFESWINLGHINGLVLFHQPINFDETRIQHDISHQVSKWFSITDLDNLISKIGELTSKETSLRGERLESVLNALGVNISKMSEQTIDISRNLDSSTEKKTPKKTTDENFSEYYHRIAIEYADINMLIVGQDPYKSFSNGVAFCMNSYYNLYEDTSGKTVLESLGYTKEVARLKSRKNPEGLFIYLLLEHGICFVNIFDEVLENLSVFERIQSAERAKIVNFPIVKKSNYIVLLGKSITKTEFVKYYPNVRVDKVLIHPSSRNKSDNFEEWSEIWSTNYLEVTFQKILTQKNKTEFF